MDVDQSNSLDLCKHCRKYVESGIACDVCEIWFYYWCEGFDTLDGYIDSGSYMWISELWNTMKAPLSTDLRTAKNNSSETFYVQAELQKSTWNLKY